MKTNERYEGSTGAVIKERPEKERQADAMAGFHAVLRAENRSPEIPESEDAYGWLVGSWDLQVLRHGKTGAERGLKAEAHFGWVLEGRAVQDVWIMPSRPERTAHLDKAENFYGTTLRVWDASIRAWRITWTDPAGNYPREEQIGKWNGKDVVQTGTRPDGTATRWRFTEITPDSFHWIGDAKLPQSGIWTIEGEFLARRKKFAVEPINSMNRSFDHIDLRVPSLAAARPFYAALLTARGFSREISDEKWLGFETESASGTTELFGLTESPRHVPNETRIAFRAQSTGEVDRLAEIVRRAGGRNIEGPGYEGPGYYAVYFEDPCGNRLEICHRVKGD